MKTGVGLPVFSGVSIGPAVVFRKSERTLPVSSGDPAIEQSKFDAAVVTARVGISCGLDDTVRLNGHQRCTDLFDSRIKRTDPGAESVLCTVGVKFFLAVIFL